MAQDRPAAGKASGAGPGGMTPDPNRKPLKSEARMGGMVAMAVLLFLAVFTALFLWMA